MENAQRETRTDFNEYATARAEMETHRRDMARVRARRDRGHGFYDIGGTRGEPVQQAHVRTVRTGCPEGWRILTGRENMQWSAKDGLREE